MPEGEVTTTQAGTTYVEQPDGSKVIPGTRRPDGTMRKEIRVKEGYTPADENKFRGFAHKMTEQTAYPPGYAPPENAPARIPGLPDDYVAENAKKAKKKKEKKEAAPKEPKEAPAAPKEPTEPKEEPPAKEAQKEAQKEEPKAAEPEKRLKNVRKKLAEIEALESRGDLSADQKKKVATKGEFEAEAHHLAKVIDAQARGITLAPKKEKTSKVAEVPVIKTATPVLAPAPAPTPTPVAPAPKKKAGGNAPEIKAKPEKAAVPVMDSAEAQKKIRNLKKKLAEIERLEQNAAELSVDQQAKVGRKKELQDELRVCEKAAK